MGFTDSINADEAEIWIEAFMKSIATGETIENAANEADAEVEDNGFGDNRTTDAEHRYLVGNGQYAPCG